MKESMSLVYKLVDLFHPLVELTVFNVEGVIQEIFNPFSNLKEDQVCDLKNCQIGTHFQQLLASGRSVRVLIHPVNEAGKVLNYIRLRYDLTHFKNLQQQLNLIIHLEDGCSKQQIDSWKEVIDQIIAHYVDEKKIDIQVLTIMQKRELVSRLRDKGLFDFKESSIYVASKLHISRATIYNYLKTAADLKKIQVHQVDAFTNKRFGGNPAGVVLDADALDEATMRKIARELNLSETAFVMSSEKGSFQIRYFTPTGHEIMFCGHSTVGALYMIAKERRFGILETGSYTFEVETRSGILKMEVFLEKEGVQVAYETPLIKLKPVDISHEMVAKAAGFKLRFINQAFPVMYEETNKDLFVVVRSLEDLKKIECDPKSFAAFSKQHDTVALCLVTPQAIDPNNQFHMRCFAPLVGIPEDPFTGSVIGGLTAYLDQFGFLSKNSSQFRIEQGHFIERPGVVDVKFSKNGAYKVTVLAEAVHCFSTEINLT